MSNNFTVSLKCPRCEKDVKLAATHFSTEGIPISGKCPNCGIQLAWAKERAILDDFVPSNGEPGELPTCTIEIRPVGPPVPRTRQTERKTGGNG